MEHDTQVAVDAVAKQKEGVLVDDYVGLLNRDFKLFADRLLQSALKRTLLLVHKTTADVLQERPDFDKRCLSQQVSLLDEVSRIVDLGRCQDI